jgi:hypothetical protein
MNYKAENLGFKNINGPMKSVRKKAEYLELKYKHCFFFKSILKLIQEDIFRISGCSAILSEKESIFKLRHPEQTF